MQKVQDKVMNEKIGETVHMQGRPKLAKTFQLCKRLQKEEY